MAVFRVVSLVDLDFHGDLTYDVIHAMIWGLAQISTALILTCCPLLRPLFEKLVPKRLTRIRTSRQKAEPIRIITNIAVLPETAGPPVTARPADPFAPVAGPVFEVEPPVTRRRRKSCPALCGCEV